MYAKRTGSRDRDCEHILCDYTSRCDCTDREQGAGSAGVGSRQQGAPELKPRSWISTAGSAGPGSRQQGAPELDVDCSFAD
ncbi:hypothetical protein ACLOJK_022249 [Asimina triloba]